MKIKRPNYHQRNKYSWYRILQVIYIFAYILAAIWIIGGTITIAYDEYSDLSGNNEWNDGTFNFGYIILSLVFGPIVAYIVIEGVKLILNYIVFGKLGKKIILEDETSEK